MGTTSGYRNFFRRITNKCYKNNHVYFFCELPSKLGWFANFLLRMVYQRIRLDVAQTDKFSQLQEDAIPVIVNKRKSIFEFLFYHRRYVHENLPVPELAFDHKIRLWQPLLRFCKIILARLDHFIQFRTLPDPYEKQYLTQSLENGKAALLSLTEKKGFYRRFVKKRPDPLAVLLEFQNHTDKPILLIPHMMFFSRRASRAKLTMIDIIFGSQENPGRIRRLWVTLFNPAGVFIEILNPVNLKELLATQNYADVALAQQAIMLRRYLIKQLDSRRRAITGPILHSKAEIKEQILTLDDFRNFAAKYATQNKIPLSLAMKKAEIYLDEIAAGYSPIAVHILNAAVSWFLNLTFVKISFDPNAFETLKKLHAKGSLIILPCHKSHIDSILIPWLFLKNGMALPKIAAGKNMAFWPMGTFFRGCGAFFLRRSFVDQKMYSRVFSDYIRYLVTNRHNIKFFMEGTRSRTGKLLRPKVGLLHMLIDAQSHGYANELSLVPISITYDRIMEEGAYATEMEGGKKKKESAFQMFKARKLLKNRYGRIYVEIEKSVQVSDYLQSLGQPFHKIPASNQRSVSRGAGYEILHRINKVALVTPHALVATAILNNLKGRVAYARLQEDLKTYMAFLSSKNVIFADSLTHDPRYAILQVMGDYVHRKLIQPIGADKHFEIENTNFQIIETHRNILEFYKNNCISHFTTAAMVALVIIRLERFEFITKDIVPQVEILRNLFKNEFVYAPDQTVQMEVRKAIKAFLDSRVLQAHATLPDTYGLIAPNQRQLRLFSGFLNPLLESYKIVHTHLSEPVLRKTNKRESLKEIQRRGLRMYKNLEIDLIESLSKATYTNAYDHFTKILQSKSQGESQFQKQGRLIERYLEFLA